MRTAHVLTLLLALTAFVGAPALLDDAAVLATFDQANGFDIETARLGAVRGNSEAVRSLAADVLRDHSMVLQMTRDLAARAGISYRVPTADDGTRSHAAALSELGRLSGVAFDAAYLRHEIGFHTGAIHVVKEVLLPSVTNPELRTLLSTVVPAFEHHLAMTREVARQLGVR
jgi:putative membrane protein